MPEGRGSTDLRLRHQRFGPISTAETGSRSDSNELTFPAD